MVGIGESSIRELSFNFALEEGESTDGTIGARLDEDVTLTFDATISNVSTYSGSVCLASNDPDTPLINIPVILTVTTTDNKIYLPVVLSD